MADLLTYFTMVEHCSQAILNSRAPTSAVMVKPLLRFLALSASSSPLVTSRPLRSLACSSHSFYYHTLSIVTLHSSYCTCLSLFYSSPQSCSHLQRHSTTSLTPTVTHTAHRQLYWSMYAYAARTFASLSALPIPPSTVIMSANPFSDCYASSESDSSPYEERTSKNDTKTIAFRDTIPVPSLKAIRPTCAPRSAFSASSSSGESSTSSPTSPSPQTKIEWTNANLGTSPPDLHHSTLSNTYQIPSSAPSIATK